ncbi:helix-turn-helix domain-containing protein [Nitrososphaera sp.]|uniref:TrmB family transcriptional regulator n=1 Tax=Nitrososphaera sp. TaxID=1971748 RepID=UPI0002617716|nr:transcriptional regulator, TrmB-like protein [uncultured archaeon]
MPHIANSTGFSHLPETVRGSGSLETRIAETEKAVLEELTRLDLSMNEAKILFNLMIHKNSTVTELASLTGIARTEMYRYLESLLSKGIVHTTFDRPQRYYALPYKEAIDHLVEIKMSALRSVSEKKDDFHRIVDGIVDSMVQEERTDNDSYQVIIGEDAMMAKLGRMIAKAEKEVTMIMQRDELVMLYRDGILSELCKLASKDVAVNIKTSYPRAQELLEEGPSATATKKKGMMIKLTIIRDAPQSLNCLVCDDRELVLVLSKASSTKRQETKTFYTNNRLMVSAFRVVLDKF